MKSQEKLLIISDSVETAEASVGGVLSYLINVLPLFTKKFSDITLAINGMTTPELLIIVERFNINLIQFPPTPKVFRNCLLSPIWNLVQSFSLRFKQYDSVFISTSSHYKYSAICFNTATTFLIHSYPERQSNLFDNLTSYLLIKRIRKGHKIFTVSHYAAKILQKFYEVEDGMINVIHNFVMDKQKTISASVADNKINALQVLTVGQLVEYKNPISWLNIALSICQENPNVNFLWVGDGPMLKEMLGKVPNKFSHRIIFLGARTCVDHYYTQADIYFHPSVKENHSLTILEAMSFALPVVANRIGGNEESIVDGITGILASVSDELRIALVKLIDNESDRKKMGTNSKDFYNQNFSIHSYNEKLDEAISHE
jgi:glycosyltransferase involved in cell wall biosynthesis